MNKNIAKYFLTLAIIALAGGGCEVNDFNDKLDGFEGGSTPENVQVIPVTLTPADYSAIASNKDNVALAASIGPDAVAALKAIGDNKFIAANDAQLYLPAFLSTTYSYLDNDSAVKVSYVHKDKSSTIVEKSLQNQYTLEDADYNGAWGDNNETPFFTKEKPAEQFVPAVLKAKVKTAAAGDYAVATYSFSNSEPTPAPTSMSARNSAPETRAVTVKKIAEIDFAKKEVATAEGTVIGLHAQGVMIKDDTGIAFFYNGSETFYTLGDVIQVSGATELRYGVNQFSRGGTATYISHPAGEFAYPAIAADITKDNIKSYNNICTHVSMTGTLKVDGNFLNIIIDGMPETEFRGSISYVFPAADIKSYDAKQITVTGYYMGNSGSTTKNFTMLLTSVKLATDGVNVTATGVAASKAGTYTCKGIVVSIYDRGFLLNDGTGHILVYQNKTSTVAEGDYVTVSGDTEIRNSMAQFKSAATVTAAADKMTVTRATPLDMLGATVDAYMTAPIYRYATFIGKLSKSDKGYYEVRNIEGTEKYGSFSYPLTAQKTELDKLLNKKVQVTGYLIGSNPVTGYFSVVFGKLEQIISYETETRYGVYTYDGAAWAAVDTKLAIAVNEVDYKEMGLANTYFDKTNSASKYIFSFLNKKYAYPVADQQVTVLYNYKEATPYMMGAAYIFDGSAWTQNLTTEQYVRSGGKWNFDPSVVITLIPDYKLATQQMKDFLQAGSDYVWENIDQKQLGITEKGKGYVSKYGTNEYYCGSSAYNINVDLRASMARAQYEAGFTGLTDEEVVALMTKRLCREVFPQMLKHTYPDAKPLSGVDVTYTINFGIYTGTKITECTHTAIYTVTGPSEFQFESLKTVEGEPVEVDE